jgi:hypothetical protein
MASPSSSWATRYNELDFAIQTAKFQLFVIPGRDEVASFDVQLHIRESIAPLAREAKWIRGPVIPGRE